MRNKKLERAGTKVNIQTLKAKVGFAKQFTTKEIEQLIAINAKQIHNL
jgi:hypothetical protein